MGLKGEEFQFEDESSLLAHNGENGEKDRISMYNPSGNPATGSSWF